MDHDESDDAAQREPAPSEARQGQAAARSDAPAGRESEDIASADALAENKSPTLPAFTPVPRQKDRSNGWKPHIQQAFIEALAETGSVRAACKRVGRADHGAYNLRRHPEAGEFRKAWDAALDLGVRRIEDAAMDRALYGTEETIHYHGEQVATRRRYNERLVMFLLRNRAPDRFTEGRPKGLNAIGKMELERKKKQWREEWEAEQRRVSPAEVRASIARKVENLRRGVEYDRQRESPRVKRLREELDEAIAADRIACYCAESDPEHELYDPDYATGGRMGPSLPLPPPDRSESEVEEDGEESEEENPRVRTIKDEGWD